MLILFYALVGAALILMLIGLYMCLRLRKVATGGTVGKVVNLLLVLILLFTAGYVAAPFMPQLPPEISLVLTAVVFFFGAAYVILVLWLINNLVAKVLATLEMD